MLQSALYAAERMRTLMVWLTSSQLYKVSLSAAKVDSRLKVANTDSKANSTVTCIPLQLLEENLKDLFPGTLQKQIMLHITQQSIPSQSHLYLEYLYPLHVFSCNKVE